MISPSNIKNELSQQHQVGSLAVLGSTGTIGEQTLDVVRRYPERFRVIALAARNNLDKLVEQCHEFQPKYACLEDERLGEHLRQRVGDTVSVICGPSALTDISQLSEVHTVVAAVVGFAGCEAVLAAIRAGKHIALANKEALVSAGELVTAALNESSSVLVPIDSEHSSLFQALRGESPAAKAQLSRLVLTASGGPFYFADDSTISQATPQTALRHPTWSMGRKISIDSATLMNKGLEVIEARWLFDLPEEKIGVIVHPQSIIHGIAEFTDGTSLMVGASPDMRLPIAYALGYLAVENPANSPGGRLGVGLPPVDLAKVGELKFHSLDDRRFPAVALSRSALRAGGTAPAILNAANEILVDKFLSKKIAFSQIVKGVETVLEQASIRSVVNFDDICEADKWARERARDIVDGA